MFCVSSFSTSRRWRSMGIRWRGPPSPARSTAASRRSAKAAVPPLGRCGVLGEAADDVEEIAERRPRTDLVVARPTHGAGERDVRTAWRHVDRHAFFDERILREVAAHLESEEIDLDRRPAARDLDTAQTAPRRDAAHGEDDLVDPAHR